MPRPRVYHGEDKWQCRQCGETKPIGEFSIELRTAANGEKYEVPKARCKACLNTADRERYDPERRKQRYVPAPDARVNENGRGTFGVHPNSIAENVNRLDAETRARYFRNRRKHNEDAAALESWGRQGFVSGSESPENYDSGPSVVEGD